MNSNIKKGEKALRRNLRSGGYTVVICAVLAAVIIFANLAVSALPVKYTSYDLTADGIYSIGDTTRQILDTVNVDINIYHVYEESAANSTEVINTANLLQDYVNENAHIKVTHVDPGVSPTFLEKYLNEGETAYDNTLIVDGPNRHTVLDAVNLYRYLFNGEYLTYEEFYSVYQMYASMGSSVPFEEFFFAEQEITSAISYVTLAEVPIVYLTDKHGESGLPTNYISAIESENAYVETLSKLEGAVPEDAEAVIISNPTTDFTAEEVALLKTYMEKGGDVILITSFKTSMNTKLPNLASLCGELGLTSKDGIIVETDKDHYYNSEAPYLIFPDINAASVPAKFMGATNVDIGLSLAHGIEISKDAPYLTTPVLTTSDKAFLMPVDASDFSQKDEYPVASFNVGVHVSVGQAPVDDSAAVPPTVTTGDETTADTTAAETVTDESATAGTTAPATEAVTEAETATTSTSSADYGSFVWYAASDICNSQFINMGNGSLFIGTVNSTCEKSVTPISIIGKSLETPYTDGVSNTTKNVYHIVFTAVIPLTILAAGVIVWYRRRSR